MPAPKKPNTAAATAAVRRRGEETMARKLRERGWTCTPPEGTVRTDYGAPKTVMTVAEVLAVGNRSCPECGHPVKGHSNSGGCRIEGASERCPCSRTLETLYNHPGYDVARSGGADLAEIWCEPGVGGHVGCDHDPDREHRSPEFPGDDTLVAQRAAGGR